ncbi:5,6-dimethylbenzimidazole synthase [Williamsia deligens]|uniref:5,6-dimethylbenzimidazole synthase n=1 Tax=Williamsia deligens TaxID=321325 RepID=A0ABW3G454_9NOCA|nr:5,6-dimethylbenzimidazole synthase [Williamsia deligens]MCP2194307.1 cob(II)yrinic acid a,c-diamide reductase [Williamsia deligens]
MTGPCDPFPDSDRAAVYRVIGSRRDTRHFAGGEVPEDVLARLLGAAHHAPSVGLMQPWRFVRVVDPAVRESIREIVEAERVRTAEALGDRGEEFARLKVEGISECAEVIVVALGTGRDAHVFGRRTMPQMDLASVACAIQNMWLAARAEGYGMGWVSMFDPAELGRLLGIPDGAEPIAVLCLGPVDAFYERPMLVETGWAVERPLGELCSVDTWRL